MLLVASLALTAALPMVEFAPRIELEAGSTAIVDAPVRLPAGLPAATARLEVQHEGAGVYVYPEAEVQVRGRASRLRWAIGAGPRPMPSEVRLLVIIEGPRRVVRRVKIRQRVDVTAAPPPTDAEVRAALAAVDRADSARTTEDADAAARPLAERLTVRRWAAIQRLKHAATRPDRWGQKAYAAVAGATTTANDAPADPKATNASMEVRLERAAAAMADFDVATAERELGAARSDPSLSRGALAQTLELQGCLQTAVGREPSARQQWTRALSLVPDLESECPIPWGRAHFDELRGTLAPDRALGVGRIALRRTDGDRGLDVTVDVAPDPGRLARTVELDIRPETDGDLVTRTLKLEHAQALGRAHAVVSTPGEPSPQVPVTVRVFDEAGILVASEGVPDPIYVPLPRERRRVRIPAWVWWVAGGAAVAGGATAAAIVASDGAGPSEPNRGLGPVDIRF
jgi:hypothetical protein